MVFNLYRSPLMASALALGLLLNGTACSLYSSDTKQTYADAEGRVPERLLHDLSNSRLGKNWVLAQLGPPLQKDSVSANHSVYTWALTREETRHRHFLLVYNSRTTLRQRDYLHVVFNGDEVFKHWLDRDAAVDRSSLFSRRESAKMAAQEPVVESYSQLSTSQRAGAQGLIVPRKPILSSTKKPAPADLAYPSPGNASAITTTINSPGAIEK